MPGCVNLIEVHLTYVDLHRGEFCYHARYPSLSLVAPLPPCPLALLDLLRHSLPHVNFILTEYLSPERGRFSLSISAGVRYSVDRYQALQKRFPRPIRS